MSQRSKLLYRAIQKTGIRRTLLTLSFALSMAPSCAIRAHAQSSPSQSFDVVSIKPNQSVNAGTSLGDSMPGKFTARNNSLLYLIEYAFDMKQSQIEGLPAWADSEKYDIDAKMDDAAAAQEKMLSRDERVKLSRTRVQALLADRFGLQLHHETKEMPVLELIAAKDGPRLNEEAATPAPGDAHPLPPGSVMMSGGGSELSITSNQAPLRILVNILSGQAELNGRILLDQTGLGGKYTFTLRWAAQHLSGEASAPSDTAGPSLFTALEEQLGLRLESAKAPVDLLVIDHVAQPSPN